MARLLKKSLFRSGNGAGKLRSQKTKEVLDMSELEKGFEEEEGGAEDGDEEEA
jgi:hypothetical protein